MFPVSLIWVGRLFTKAAWSIKSIHLKICRIFYPVNLTTNIWWNINWSTILPLTVISDDCAGSLLMRWVQKNEVCDLHPGRNTCYPDIPSVASQEIVQPLSIRNFTASQPGQKNPGIYYKSNKKNICWIINMLWTLLLRRKHLHLPILKTAQSCQC